MLSTDRVLCVMFGLYIVIWLAALATSIRADQMAERNWKAGQARSAEPIKMQVEYTLPKGK